MSRKGSEKKKKEIERKGRKKERIICKEDRF